MRRRFTSTALIAFLTLSLLTVSSAQSTKKKKKIKDFGSSLNRLKWDVEKKTAVDSSSGSEVSEGDVIRFDTLLVSSELLVLDKAGRAVAGLSAGDFSIVEDGTPQKVEHFFHGDNVSIPRSLVLIIDYSASQLPYLKRSVAAAKVLVDKLSSKDRMAIVTDDVDLLLDFTGDKNKLKDELDTLLERAKLKPTFFGRFGRLRLGRSAQYSALMATLKEAFDEEDVRPIIIFQTDGDEALFLRDPVVTMTFPEGLKGEALAMAQESFQFHQSELKKNLTEFSLDDIYRAVERSRATMYTVIPGPKLAGLSLDDQAKKLNVDRKAANADILATMSSGARAKAEKQIELDETNYTEDYDRWRADLKAKMESALAGVATVTGGWTEYLERPEQADGI